MWVTTTPRQRFASTSITLSKPVRPKFESFSARPAGGETTTPRMRRVDRSIGLDEAYTAIVGEQRGAPLRSNPRRSQPQRSRWSEGRGPRGMRASKARTGLRARLACHRRRTACGNYLPFGPEVGAVCGKAARTVLCGGPAMKRASLPLQRRTFISLLGGAAAAWPLAARAQPGERVRRIGILMPFPPTNAEMQARVRAFREELRKRGWAASVNAQFDERWTS